MKLRTWLQGAGVAALVLFPFYRAFIDMPADMRMHTPMSAATLTVSLSLIANLVVMSLVCMLLGTWLHSTSRWAWLRLFVPALVLASLAEMVRIARTNWESTQLWLIVLAITMVLTLLLHWYWRRGEALLFQLCGAVLIGLGFFCIFVVFQLLHLAMWHEPPNSTGVTIPETVNRADRPRIIWILFDELSYQQVFGDRYPNLQLPNFDEFRKSSVLFTDTRPINDETEKAIPSILVGQVVDRENYTARNQLQIGAATGPLHPFNAAQTPFALARQYGTTTGVVGWYNPYCDILAPYLNQCYWNDEWLIPSVFSQADFWKKFVNPWIFYGVVFSHPLQMLSRSYRSGIVKRLLEPEGDRNRAREYLDLMRHADRMLGPSGPDFVFLHLPVPHPVGFYNRETQQFDISGDRSYIDNLALADQALGQLLAILRQSPRWKNTSVVVCGDHSWRVYSWRRLQFWTPEDEAASHGGVFDPRPLLMVHLAGQTTPATVSGPFPLLKLHDILDDLVTGKQPVFPSH